MIKIKKAEISNEYLIKICKPLLSTSLKGNSQNEFNTFTVTQGPIYINDCLKKIRIDAIELLFSLFDVKNDCKYNESIIEALFLSIKIHHQNIRKEDLAVLRDNAKYILTNIKSNYPFMKNRLKRKIESELKYPSKPVFEGVYEVNQIVELINKDQEYQKYRAFIGYETDYGPDWETVEKDRKKLLDKFVDEMRACDVANWIKYMKNIVKDYDKKDYGLFQNLHYFLNLLGKKKPQLGNKFKSIVEIENFQVSLLCGLLESDEKTKHYDEIKDWINKSERLSDIAVTFRFFSDYDDETFTNLVNNSLKKEEINQWVRTGGAASAIEPKDQR